MFRISSIFTCAALTLSLGAALSGPAAAQAQSVTVSIPFLTSRLTTSMCLQAHTAFHLLHRDIFRSSTPSPLKTST